jgi:hypothetical protein
MPVCEKCSEMFDTELMHDTQKLRLKLISEETKIVQYMDRIMVWLKEEINSNYQNHDCNHTQLRVLGPAKAKKFNITKPKANSKAKKASVPKVKRLKSNSRTPKKTPKILVDESSQSISTNQHESTGTL